jgi:hypothetical protein
VKGWEKTYQANSPQKQSGVAILISDKVDFKPTLIKHDKEGHQKEITNINLYTPKVHAPNFIKRTLKDLKTYIDTNTVAVGDFNTPISPIDRSSKQKINKKVLALNHTINQMDLADVCTIYILLSSPWNLILN